MGKLVHGGCATAHSPQRVAETPSAGAKKTHAGELAHVCLSIEAMLHDKIIAVLT